MSAQVEPTGYLDHVPANARAGLTAMNAGKPLAALNGDVESIIAMFESGDTALQIAGKLGITHVALYKWLLRNCPEEWQAISAAKQLVKLDECEAVWDSKYSGDARADGVTVSRTREKMKQAQWHLERANRKLFGDTKQIDINQSVTQELRIISDPGGILAKRLQQEADSVVIDVLAEDQPETVSD